MVRMTMFFSSPFPKAYHDEYILSPQADTPMVIDTCLSKQTSLIAGLLTSFLAHYDLGRVLIWQTCRTTSQA